MSEEDQQMSKEIPQQPLTPSSLSTSSTTSSSCINSNSVLNINDTLSEFDILQDSSSLLSTAAPLPPPCLLELEGVQFWLFQKPNMSHELSITESKVEECSNDSFHGESLKDNLEVEESDRKHNAKGNVKDKSGIATSESLQHEYEQLQEENIVFGQPEDEPQVLFENLLMYFITELKLAFGIEQDVTLEFPQLDLYIPEVRCFIF